MKHYRLINNISGWVAFVVAAITYLLTIEPTASFWDCGEFISTGFKLEVGHPPGAPTFMLFARLATLFASDVTQVGALVNAFSALASALTILFLFWSITHLARKFFADPQPTMAQTIAIMGAGMVGALAYTFSDTFWFSAVEGEVYASSSLFTALVFWAILKWEEAADEKYANRWIILIAYLMGLSIGVHLLNLLAIPAIVFVFYFRKYRTTPKGVLAASGIAILALGAIMYGIIPGIVNLAAKFELLFVNGLGLPFNSGAIFYFLLVVGLIVWGLLYTSRKEKVLANTIILSVTVILLGYSTFAIVVIRSLADPPMDQNNPDNVFNLLGYLNREQYGDRPLIFGQYYNAPLDPQDPIIKGEEKYIEKDGKYVVSDTKISYNYDKRFTTFFPRMYSTSENHIEEYKRWANIQGTPIQVPKQDGQTETLIKPTFGENLTFFFRYQVNFMYWRYLMWNFAGRQNDVQGSGEVTAGNWISGIPFLDEARLGPQDYVPTQFRNNPATNKYYFLPFLMALLGFFHFYARNKKDFTITTLLFFFTGFAIVIYLNQTPLQPRERDYAYAGSFYAFSIYLGIGVLALYDLLKRIAPQLFSAALVSVVSLGIPALMASENWDDHDRSDRFVARDFAYNYLNSCEPNAILFTNGDNDTFPLWYAQEVEGIRTDVRVCNLSYLSTDWYIDQMRRKAYLSEPVPFSLSPDKYVMGKRDYVPMMDKSTDFIDLKRVVQFIGSDDPSAKVPAQDGEMLNYTPTRNLRIPVDSALLVNNGTVKKADIPLMLKNIDWKLNKSYLMKNDLMVLDMLATNAWKRPVYFAITVGGESYLKLEPFFRIEGLAYRVVPFNTPRGGGQIGKLDTDIMYGMLMKTFKWGGIENPDVYLDENILRMMMNFKSNFSRLALQLIEEGQPAKAAEVADRCQKLMPKERMPYNYFNLQLADVYFQAKVPEKGNEIMETMLKNSEDDMAYYMSLTPEQRGTVDSDVQRSLAMMREIGRVSVKNGLTQLEKKASMVFEKYFQQYSGGK